LLLNTLVVLFQGNSDILSERWVTSFPCVLQDAQRLAFVVQKAHPITSVLRLVASAKGRCSASSCPSPSVSAFEARGGKGVVVPGCPACRTRINTMSQFLDHLANDAMPKLLDQLSKQ
jgi:hypothetical protein